MFETPPQQKPPEKKQETMSFIDYFTNAFVQIIESIARPFGDKDNNE